jgi:hypothetical protein
MHLSLMTSTQGVISSRLHHFRLFVDSGVLVSVVLSPWDMVSMSQIDSYAVVTMAQRLNMQILRDLIKET